MAEKNYRSLSLKYLIIPILVLTLLFSFLSYKSIDLIEDYFCKEMQNESQKIARGYSYSLEKGLDANLLFDDLLREKLTATSQVAALLGKNYTEDISQLATFLNIDDIHVYDNEGVIINSTNEKYIGWTADAGHPVYNFMEGSQISFVEEIRPDSETGINYKYGYFKNLDGSFIQVGIKAENITELLAEFSLGHLMTEIQEVTEIERISYLDAGLNLEASSAANSSLDFFKKEEIRESLEQNNKYFSFVNINGKEYYKTIFKITHDQHDSHDLGYLSIVYPLDETKKAISDFKNIAIAVIVTFYIILIYGFFLSYRKNKRLIKIAYFDQLTELPNKEYLKDVLENEMEGKNSALFLINCDNFNLINLSLGYKFGDQLIKETALQIKKITDENKKLFRFEEDKFILLFENYQDDDQLEELIESINNEIEEISLKSKFDNQYLSSSIAVEKDINQYGSVEEIMNNLNIVLDYVKSSSSNYLFFNQQMKEKINRKDEIEKELRESIRLEDERIHLNYQPIFDLKEQKIAAFEALARLKTNKYGNVSPEEFIQIAEDRHLIIPLSKLILKKASKFSAKLDKHGFKKLKVSVNMSGLDLIQEDFTENIIKIIRENGAKTENIKVEITESVLLNNFDLINLKLSQLKKEGITSALDDFGTGYSSFYRMTELNIDLVKIDKYFINKITKGTENSIVAAAIIELSHSLGLSVIAEGVETEAEKDYLIENNCDYIQGYLFSRPLSEKDAFVLLKNFKV